MNITTVWMSASSKNRTRGDEPGAESNPFPITSKHIRKSKLLVAGSINSPIEGKE